MKFLTQDQKAQYKTKPLNRQGWVRSLLMNMKVGDIILIEDKDWHWRSAAPTFLARRVEKVTGWEFQCERAMMPDSGWIITRSK